MPTLSRRDATGTLDNRSAEWGDLMVHVSQNPQGDTGPLLKGLPDDRCPCPHWGYLLRGRMRVRYADHEEIIEAGQAYYLPPGHVTENLEEIEAVQFSPTAQMREVIDTIVRNTQAMQRPR